MTIKSVVITRAVMPWVAKVYLEIISPVCRKLEMREPTITMQSVQMDLPLWVPSSQVLTLPWKLNKCPSMTSKVLDSSALNDRWVTPKAEPSCDFFSEQADRSVPGH